MGRGGVSEGPLEAVSVWGGGGEEVSEGPLEAVWWGAGGSE